VKSAHQLDLVLASTAAWRSEALSRLGLKHKAMAPQFEEPPFVGGKLEDHVRALALGKAKSLAGPGLVVLGFDQMIEVGTQVLGKPGNFENALAQLRLLNGKRHRLVNGLAVVTPDQTLQLWDQCFLTMRSLSEPELCYYLEQDQPFGCAGSYKIEGLGASLFESVEVSDLGSIVGLPTNLVGNALRSLGFSNLLP